MVSLLSDGDPLAGLALPPGDAGELIVQAARIGNWVRGADRCGGGQQAVMEGITATEWRGAGASAAHSGSERVVAAYAKAAQDLAPAVSLLRECASEWEAAAAEFARARQMADEAMMEESVCLPGADTSPSDLRHTARAMAEKAIEDFRSASSRTASRLADLDRRVQSMPGFIPVPHHHWWDSPLHWGSDALRAARTPLDDTLNAASYLASHPKQLGQLLQAGAEVDVGGGLAALGVAAFGGGVLLDATGIGIPAGVAVDAAAALGIAGGVGLVVHGAAGALGDIGHAYSVSIDGGRFDRIPTDPEPDWLEGRNKVIVRDPLDPGRSITDIDRVANGVLWEDKTATSAADTQAWIEKHVVGKFNRYLECRRLLPGYGDAPIGFDFATPDVSPAFRTAVEAEIQSLRLANPEVTIYLKWAS